MICKGVPGIAFPRNISSEVKNSGGGGTSLPSAFSKKPTVPALSRSSDKEDDEQHYPSIVNSSRGVDSREERKQKKAKDHDRMQLPDFSSRTTLPSAGNVPISARTEDTSRESSPSQGLEKKKKKKDKGYDKGKAQLILNMVSMHEVFKVLFF